MDKTGRVQHFDGEGKPLDGSSMPEVQAGEPTSIAVAANGRLAVCEFGNNRVQVWHLE